MHQRTDSAIGLIEENHSIHQAKEHPFDARADQPAEVTTDIQNGSEPDKSQLSQTQSDLNAKVSVSPSPLLSHVKGVEWPEEVPPIWELFVDSIAKHPDALAIASINQHGELYGLKNSPLDHESYQLQPYVRWSYAEFAKGVKRTIIALRKLGAGEHFPIFTFVNNVVEYPLIFWAAVTLGCTIIPINPRNVLNKEEVTHILTRAISTSPANEAIVFVQNEDLARQILELGVLYKTHVVALDSQPGSTYLSFGNFILSEDGREDTTFSAYRESAKHWGLTLFTSGTTALPKGVVLDAFRLDRWMVRRRNTIPLIPGDSVLLNLPNNHAFYYLNILTYPCCGGAMVLSGSSFSPQTFPDIMDRERCTHLPMPPALIHAVVQVALARGVRFETLKCITTGGSKLSVDFVRDCFDVLGTRGVEVMYGSTETGLAVTTSIISHVSQIVREDDASVGWVDLGAEIKICAPGETTPLPRNTEGEVHYGSLVRADGYAGEELPENFYTDENGQKWFATGDAATMNDEGMIFIVGRIKDLIIRGATNISPAAIEFVLDQNPETKFFNIQIVGKLDPIAGDVPVAVSQKSISSQDIENVQSTVLKHMGPVFLPEEVITLKDLGLDDFPRTILGKIQKGKLTKIVGQFFQNRDTPQTNDEVEIDQLTSKVQKVWTRTIGHEVDTRAKMSDFADSITIMRVRDRFAKDLGAKLTLAEILSTQTVGEQIKMIREYSDKTKPRKIVTEGPEVLTSRDLIHLAGMPEWFASTKAYISHKISKAGLAWEDIQAITPASDFTQILNQADIMNYGWSWKFALLAKSGISKNALRKGIEVMLTNNPILSSFFLSEREAFGSDIALHVLPKTNQKLFNAVFRDCGSITTKEEFAKLVFRPYEYEMAILPGPLVYFLLFDIEETGQSGTIMVSHHAVTDASYIQLVFDDLDKALGGATSLDEHISYKTWADSYFALRTTPEAQNAVRWHINRLRDLSYKKDSVFPQLPRPHHFTTNHVHIQDVGDNGFHTSFHAQGMTNLRRRYPSLSAPTIIKAAWSLMNIHRNNTSVAIFSNLQADRRRFPFVPKALEALSPAHSFEASNVAGLTLQDVVNIIPLHSEEKIIDFLHRVTADQEELNEYAAAPMKMLLQELGPINSEIMLDILRSQIFNWTPGLSAMQTHNANENFEPLSMFIRPGLRLVINVDVGGNNNETVFFQIKSPLYDLDGLQGLASDFEDFVHFICNETNWDRRSGDFRNALRAPLESKVQQNGKLEQHVF